MKMGTSERKGYDSKQTPDLASIQSGAMETCRRTSQMKYLQEDQDEFQCPSKKKFADRLLWEESGIRGEI